jgi:hypothetical protein
MTPAWTAESNQAFAEFGSSVSKAGDVNDDGYSDVVIGASMYDNGQVNEGRVYVYLGSISGLSSVASWTAESDQASAEFGASVSTAGDVNRDVFSDVIVGAFEYDNGDQNEGRAYAYLGSASGLSATPAWIVESNQSGALFGFSVSTAGDVNADGFSDVVVGSPYFDNGHVDEGRAYVYLGSASGLSATSSWIGENNLAGTQFGRSVSSAGDVNGDAYSDILVGADGGLGRSYVYLGSGDPPSGSRGETSPTSGLSVIPIWTVESDQANASFGSSVSTAGDVNGDGFSDVIVGARRYDNGQSDEGRALVWLGNEKTTAGAWEALRPRQRNFWGPIDLLGISDQSSTFYLNVRGRTPAGRAKVCLEWDVAELQDVFDPDQRGKGTCLDTGTPVAGQGSAVDLTGTVLHCFPGTSYHWRLRVASNSPHFPHSPWLKVAPSVPSLKQLRTKILSSPLVGGLETRDELMARPGIELETVRPNPFAPRAEITYLVSSAGHVRLGIYDATGRSVYTLVDGFLDSGRRVAAWNGQDYSGVPVPAGVYFARLEVLGEVRTRKLLLLK